MDSKGLQANAPRSRRLDQLASAKMSAPLTPSKRARIVEIVEELNRKWGLGIPTPGASDSPARRASTNDAGKALDPLSFFVMQRHDKRLEAVLRTFEDQARTINSNWISKPRADPDTIPQRHSSELPGAPVHNVPDTVKKHLLETLYTLLRDERAKIRNEQANTENHTSKPEPESPTKKSTRNNMTKPTTRRSAAPSSHGVPISNFFPKRAKSPVKQAQADITKNNPGAKEGMKVPDDRFATPPQSDEELEKRGAHDTFESKQDAVGVKRPSSPPGFERFLPRKTRRSAGAEAENSYPIYHHEAAPHSATSLPRGNAQGVPATTSFTAPATKASSAYVQPGHQTNGHERAASNSAQPTVLGSKPRSAATSFSKSLNTSFNTVHGSPADTAATSPSLMSFNGALADQSATAEEQEHIGPVTDIVFDGDQSKDLETPPQEKVNTKTAVLIAGLPAAEYFEKRLFQNGPLVERVDYSKVQGKPSFRINYEVIRVSLYTGVSASALYERLASKNLLSSAEEGSSKHYNQVWSALAGRVAIDRKTLPERSSVSAWEKAEKAFIGVSLGGELTYSKSGQDSLFQFQLKPLKTEPSYRLQRHFGGHRFLQLSLPGLRPRELPEHLKDSADLARQRIIDWLLDCTHEILGRRWRPFFSKPEPTSTTSRKAKKYVFNESQTRLYLFAETGHGFQLPTSQRSGDISDVRSPPVWSVEKMIEWLIEIPRHADELCPKLYARIALGVSQTVPTYAFAWHQIVRTDDALSSSPVKRTLDRKRSNDKKGGAPKLADGSAVMNDGCARISRLAARHVADMLGMQDMPTPTAFQGRIGGAKGVWFVDPANEEGEDKVWIEVSDSQLKYEWHDVDKTYPDKLRLTFEVSSRPISLRSARLNFQLLPLLISRGVPARLLEAYLTADIDEQVVRAKAATDSPRSLAAWCQERSPLQSRRKQDGSIEWQGAVPRNEIDRIQRLIESGFHPRECQYLHNLVYRAMKNYVSQIIDRMSISIDLSCYALCIADPFAVLEEDEVSFMFSRDFNGNYRDPSDSTKLRFRSDCFLLNEDVLVTRSPQHQVSDVQKVRAVFRPELAHIKDVIVFPSRGRQALADKLSGGDYDGDRVWVCWDPALVKDFQNAEVPTGATFQHFGIRKEVTKVSNLGQNSTSKILRKGLEAAFQPPLLGSTVSYLEKLTYSNWSTMGGKAMETQEAKELGQLAGLLVDAPKAGLSWSDADFKAYLKSKGLPISISQPCYKSGCKPRTLGHPIDNARAKAHSVGEKVLKDLKEAYPTTVAYDATLSAVYKGWEERAKDNEPLRDTLDGLKKQFESLKAFWRKHASTESDRDDLNEQTRAGAMSFGALVEQARERFVQIQPPALDHPTVSQWRHEHEMAVLSPSSSWLQLKASMLYYHHHKNSSMLWWVAMRELCYLKAFATDPQPTVVINGIHDILKVDTRQLRNIESLSAEQMATYQGAIEDEYAEGCLQDDELLDLIDSAVLGSQYEF